jgi:hypothetical protein
VWRAYLRPVFSGDGAGTPRPQSPADHRKRVQMFTTNAVHMAIDTSFCQERDNKRVIRHREFSEIPSERNQFFAKTHRG